MITREIVCMYCGKAGRIEVPGLDEGESSSTLFRHLGHNPVSGHMHYQCPSCRIVLLVEPMAILSVGGLLKGRPRLADPSPEERTILEDLSRGVAMIRRMFHTAGTSH
jgi:hypothetical protein